MATTRATLKQYFKKYATPTEAQFHELIDAFVHKDEDSLTQSKIDGLVQALSEKVTTNEVNTLVENKVTEIVSDPQFSAAPTAHSHVAADVEGLSDFITRVTNFLDSADVSDTTINRWKEIETFLTGITDQETLTGLLLQLKNEILAQIPEPQTGNYLKQISDLDAYTEAQEGEIVQYVGSTTENYRRGFCYERVAGESLVIPSGTEGRVYSTSSYNQEYDCDNDREVYPTGRVFDGYSVSINNNPDQPNFAHFVIGEPEVGNYAYMNGKKEIIRVTTISGEGQCYYLTGYEGPYKWTAPIKIEELVSKIGTIILHPIRIDGTIGEPDYLIRESDGMFHQNSGSTTIQSEQDIVYGEIPAHWQPIATSPVVS
jgi:hypothetical protein